MTGNNPLKKEKKPPNFEGTEAICGAIEKKQPIFFTPP
jgi:hypothetical protein